MPGGTVGPRCRRRTAAPRSRPGGFRGAGRARATHDSQSRSSRNPLHPAECATVMQHRAATRLRCAETIAASPMPLPPMRGFEASSRRACLLLNARNPWEASRSARRRARFLPRSLVLHHSPMRKPKTRNLQEKSATRGPSSIRRRPGKHRNGWLNPSCGVARALSSTLCLRE